MFHASCFKFHGYLPGEKKIMKKCFKTVQYVRATQGQNGAFRFGREVVIARLGTTKVNIEVGSFFPQPSSGP